MALKFVSVALVSVLVLLVGSIPSDVSAATPPSPPPPPVKMPPTNYTAIAIGGEVFCKNCKLDGYLDFLKASPVKGAIVRVSCFNKNWKLISQSAASNPIGFFYMKWTDVASFDPNRCRVYIDWSPLSFCNVPVFWPGTYGSYLYLVEEKAVPGGKQGTYSPGVVFLDQPKGATCPPKK